MDTRPAAVKYRVASASIAAFALYCLAGCSQDTSSSPPAGKGGSGGQGVGGTVASGGSVGSGGTKATGGTTSTGGSTATGGATSSGGVTGSGGNPASGGVIGTGGTIPTGGTTATGGTTSSGGRTGTGGTVASGGSNAGGAGTGGAATGGTTGPGGSSTGGAATGGGTGTGGARTGGTSGGGGTTTTGGTTGTGGTTSTILGATPPMGWNSWNKFACNGLNETVVKKMADAFITSGMKDAGYQYVNLDDCWMDGRDSASGKIKVSGSKFPSGIAALADYVHGKGLKLGIYSTPNTKTCAGLYGGYTGGVGSLGYETTDAQTYADWGVDYLKYDKCQGQLSAFAVMRDALKKTGRPIFYSINPADQGPYCTPTSCSIDLVSIANMWRIEFDISAKWSEIIRLIDKDKPEYVGAGPGHWNDPDMLEVGNGLNDTEGRAHFSMWCIMAAPLITGNDLSTMSATTKATLTNKEIIAVDQDALGYQGRVVAGNGTNQEVWSKNLTGTNTRAVALFNRGTSSANITVQWSQLGIPTGAATVRDLWAGKDLGSFTGSYTANNVASHDVVMLKIVSAP
jgi:alpha-galactosidase